MSACSDAARYFSDPATACAVCQAESGSNPNAVGDGGTSYGLFQIHVPAHPDFDISRAFDPAYNAQYAAGLQRSSGWGPWSTYNSGAYRQYLNSCGGSSSPMLGSGPVAGGVNLGIGATVAVLALGALLLYEAA